MLTYPDFVAEDDKAIAYGFFSRVGGVSSGVFSSLNCKEGAGDDDDDVEENRNIVTDALFVDDTHLVTLDQVHGATCLTVSRPLKKQAEGDALVTSTPGLAIGVLTADCAPVLFSGSKADGSPVIGAAHAGWGGAVKGVLEATIDAMLKEGAEPDSLRAAIGPCIAKPSYEVSAGFEAPFIAEDVASQRFFSLYKDGKLLFDLAGYVAFRLKRAGVSQIIIGGQDTYSDETNWFSFRRSTYRKESLYGRQISVISIRNS